MRGDKVWRVLLVDTVSRRKDPALTNQRPPAGDPLGQETLLDDGGHPGVASELRVLAPHNPVAARVDLATL